MSRRPVQPVVDNRPMSELGEWGEVTYSEEWLHGCTTASWQSTPGVRHDALRMGARVQLRKKGWPVWAGILQQPGVDGMFYARGLWTQAERVPAIDGAGNATYVPDTAIVNAINRGDLWWRLPDSVSTAPVLTDDEAGSAGILMVADLLDRWAAKAGKRWGVNGRREVYTSAWPALPSWQLAPGATPLTPADDDVANYLIGRFLNSAGTYEPASVVDTLSRDRFGTRAVIIDLTSHGVLDAGGAVAILDGLLQGGKARMGWAEPIEVGRGDLLNMGGAAGQAIKVGDGVRVLGAYDPTWTSAPKSFTEAVAGKIDHRADGSLLIYPEGKASRSLAELLADMRGAA